MVRLSCLWAQENTKFACVCMRVQAIADIRCVFTAGNWGWSRHWLIISYCVWISDCFNALAQYVHLIKVFIGNTFAKCVSRGAKSHQEFCKRYPLFTVQCRQHRTEYWKICSVLDKKGYKNLCFLKIMSDWHWAGMKTFKLRNIGILNIPRESWISLCSLEYCMVSRLNFCTITVFRDVIPFGLV